MITLQTVPVDLLLNIGTYLQGRSSEIVDINRTTLAAILNDHDMLENHMQKYTPSNISVSVAISGNLKALKWVVKKGGCPMNEDTSVAAAKGGNLKICKWLHSRGCPWDTWTCQAAAENGHLEVLQWLHSQGCPWNEEACNAAAWNGHLETLQWLHSAGCPFNRREIWRDAVDSGNQEMLEWLQMEGCGWRERRYDSKPSRYYR